VSTPDQTAGHDELPVIEFVTPIPGFPEQRRFLLTLVEEHGLLYALRSLDDPELRFLVIAPAPFFPDYAPEIDRATLALLGGDDPDQLLVLLVVTVGEQTAGATANLFAPIIVNQRSRRAAQVVLSGTDLPIRAPLATVGA
jgi:flagellar assembly factor FliW